jgi:hypothetical protein
VGLKIRVLALPTQIKGAPVPSVVYRAEAYEEHDSFREPKWTCPHRHESAQEAHSCGLGWQAGRSEAEDEGAALA